MTRGCSACCCRVRRVATRRSLRSTWRRSRSSPGTTAQSGGTHSSRTAPASSAPTWSPRSIMRSLLIRAVRLPWGPPNGSRAIAVEGGYRVTGKWDFASGCRQARWMGAHCHVVEADGTLRLNRFGRPTERTLLFPVSEATLLDTWKTIGLRGTASDSYCVNDLFVSEAFSSTREDPTLRRERGPLYAFTTQSLYATGVAAVALGIARAMLSEFVTLASRKSPRGLRPARRQRCRAGRCGARGGAARLGARLPDRDAQHDLRACRRHGADRGERPGARAARLHQRDSRRGRGRRLRLQGSGY